MTTHPEEFRKFDEALMSNAPEGYVPWYFPVGGNKAPDAEAIAARSDGGTQRYSWKAAHARLNFDEAMHRLGQGFNVGIAARKDDPLIIVDIDTPAHANELKPTLTAISRKRIGKHGYYLSMGEKFNIPTGCGEVRSIDQYVVAPGSYVQTTEEELAKMVGARELSEEDKRKALADPMLGVYTIDNLMPPTTLSFDELPSFFKEKSAESKAKEKEIVELKKSLKPIEHKGRASALFQLTIADLVPYPPGRRDPHPLHDSDTGANFSVSNGLAHCWRHEVSLNALQYLVVKSGYMACEDAGSPHGRGNSKMVGDDGAIFHAWLQAKRDGVIAQDDAVPISAMLYIARKHKVCDESLIPKRWEYPDKRLPPGAHNEVLEIIRKVY